MHTIEVNIKTTLLELYCELHRVLILCYLGQVLYHNAPIHCSAHAPCWELIARAEINTGFVRTFP